MYVQTALHLLGSFLCVTNVVFNYFYQIDEEVTLALSMCEPSMMEVIKCWLMGVQMFS